MSSIPRLCLFGMILPLSALATLAAQERGVEKTAGEVKILAQGAWTHLSAHGPGTHLRDQRQWTIRGKEQLEQAAGPHAPSTIARALGVKAVDFDKHMILAVFDGSQPMVGVSGGGPPSALYRVAITSLSKDAANKAMTVEWRRVPRRANDPILSYPLEAILIERFDGEVKFQKLPAAEQGKEDAAPKVVARAFWPDGWKPEMPPQQWIVRSAAELIDPRLAAPEPVLEKMRQEAAARYARALGIGAVDFSRHMIVGVSGGAQPAGTRVEVSRIERDAGGKSLTLHWKLQTPTPAAAADLAHPAAVVLIEQFPGAVRFQKEGN